MVTIGDVFSVIGGLVGICVTAWALIMGTALLFQSSASRARDAYRAAPWKGLGLGMLSTVFLGFFGIVLSSIPVPLVKLAGLGFFLALMALAALGASGLSLLIAERVAALDPSISRFGAMQKACAILVIAGVFPVLGWFLVGPVFVIASAGYGLQALLARETSRVSPTINGI